MKRKKSGEVKVSFESAQIRTGLLCFLQQIKLPQCWALKGAAITGVACRRVLYCSSSTNNPFSEGAMEKRGNRMNKYKKKIETKDENPCCSDALQGAGLATTAPPVPPVLPWEVPVGALLPMLGSSVPGRCN